MDGGVEYSIPAHDLDPNQLYDATNLYYDISTGRLTTRPGLVRQTTDASPEALVNVTTVIAGGAWRVVVATYYKLFYLDGDALVEIGDLAGTSGNTVPCFASFNGNLYIASGSRLQKWDGTTLTNNVTPHDCTIVMSKAGRLYTNDTSDGDIIKACGFLNDSQWVYPDAIYYQAGWKDGDSIVGMLPLGNDIVVMKGDKFKAVVAIKGTYPDFQIVELTRGNSCLGFRCLDVVGRDMLALDNDGINSVSGVIEYGDLKIDPMGTPVAAPITRMVDESGFMVTWSDLGIQMVFPNSVNSTAYVLHYAARRDVAPFRWTRFSFGVPRVSGAAYDPSTKTVYVVSGNGHVYTLNKTFAQTVYQDDGEYYEQAWRSKIFDPSGAELYMKRAAVHIEALDANAGVGVVDFYAYKDDGNVAINLLGSGNSYNFAPPYGADWDAPATEPETGGYAGMPEPSDTIRAVKELRESNLQFGMLINDGAVSISRVHVDAVIVGRE